MSTVNITVSEFYAKGCGCQYGVEKENCLTGFDRADIERIRDAFLEMDSTEKDMFVLSLMCQQRKPGEESHGLTYMMEGKKVCRTTFLFLLSISKEKLQRISQHYNDNDLTARRHGNCGKAPSNSHSFETRRHVKEFIENYANDHGVSLPGRIPGHRDESITLISSAESKRSVWKFYSDSCLKSLLKPVCYSLFVELWNEVIPWVVIAKPATDLCWKCQQNNNAILKASNVPDEDKAGLLMDQLKHLEDAKKEREYYKTVPVVKRKSSRIFPKLQPLRASSTLFIRRYCPLQLGFCTTDPLPIRPFPTWSSLL